MVFSGLEPHSYFPPQYQGFNLLCCGALALGATVMVMPLALLAGSRLGLVDHPDDRRKPGQTPVPRVGGLAMAMGAGVAVVPSLSMALGIPLAHHGWVAAGLLLVVVLGVVDDRFGMRGRHKLLGQVIASLLIVLPGRQSIEAVQVAGWDFPLGPWGAFIAIFLLVGAMNAANLLDGMDGFLGTVGLASGATILAVAHVRELHGVMLATSLFIGSLAGFMAFNYPPARVYLGDCGSMLVGATLALLAIGCGHPGAQAANVSLALPAGVLFLPILDTLAAIIRRGLTGRSIYSPDRGHLHHCLALAGWSPRKSMALVLVMGLGIGAMVVLGQVIEDDRPAWVAMAAVAAGLVLTGLFGRGEARLVARRLKALVRGRSPATGASESGIGLHLLGGGPWDDLWSQLISAGQEAKVAELSLDIDMPWLNESFNGQWDDGSALEPAECWTLEFPVAARGRVMARVRVVSSGAGQPVNQAYSSFQPILERLKAVAWALETGARGGKDELLNPVVGTAKP